MFCGRSFLTYVCKCLAGQMMVIILRNSSGFMCIFLSPLTELDERAISSGEIKFWCSEKGRTLAGGIVHGAIWFIAH